jgi:rhamnosyl/mannosyltransferase
MNILHLYSEYFPLIGGIENYVQVLAEAQVAGGHTVRVLCCAPDRRSSVAMVNGVTVERVGCRVRLNGMPFGNAYGRRLRALQTDMVHLHMPFPLGEYGAMRLPPGVPVVATFHCAPLQVRFLPRLYRRIQRLLLTRASAVIVTSEALAQHTPLLAPYRDKWRVVPVGTDTTLFHPEGPRLADAAPLLFVGKPRSYKGLDDLLQALVQLPDVRLDIVGEGPQTPQVRAWAQAFGVADRVRFLGELSGADLAACYRGTRLLVLPSNCHTETFGIVLIEAMACGRACLTTEVGTGTSWVVQDGATGRVVPPCRSDLLAAALREMLADPARLCRMGAAGRERVMQLYTRASMVAGVEQVYHEFAGA